MSRMMCLMLLALAAAFTPLTDALAVVVPLVHYRAGENDTGAFAGGPANTTTTDFTGNMFDATTGGAATYTSNTPYAPSNLAFDFPGGVTYSRPIVTTATDNWGLESWIRFNTVPAANAVVFYNGNASNSGFGLLAGPGASPTSTPNWHMLIGGHNFGNTGVPIVGGIWTHVAAVRNAGTLQFYLNGNPVGTTFTTNPNTPTGNLSFGVLDGQMDELRLFSFNPGEFDPSTDLLFHAPNLTALLPPPIIPEPASATLMAVGFVMFISQWRRRRRAG